MNIRRNLFIGVFIMLSCFSVAQNDSLVGLITYRGYSVWFDNSYNAWYSIFIKGDSVIPVGEDTRFFVVDDKIFQVMKYEITPDMYHNGMPEEKEIQMLGFIRDYEKDYLENELLMHPIEIKEEFIRNQYGKNFHLWYYKLPEEEENKNAVTQDTSDLATVNYQLYLTFIANNHVGMVNMPVMQGQDLVQRIEYMQQLANRVYVFGWDMSLDGIYFRIDSWQDGASTEYVDSVEGWKFVMPEWMNLCETNTSNYLMGNLPDSGNIKNAIGIAFFDKSEYNSLKEFSREMITGKDISNVVPDDRIIEKDGISAKVLRTSGDAMVYHCHYHTMETTGFYILLNFTATETTYEYNLPRYFEFVSGVKKF